MRRGGGVNSIASVLGRHLDAMQIDRKIREHTAPLVWAEVVGPQVAGATEVLGVEGGVLRVSTKSAVWANELTFYKPEFLRRLNARIGARPGDPILRDIHFQNRGLRKTEAPEYVEPALDLDAVSLSPAEVELVEAEVGRIQDEALRERVRRCRLADVRLRTWRLDNGWAPCRQCGDLVAPIGGDATGTCHRCRLLAGKPTPGFRE